MRVGRANQVMNFRIGPSALTLALAAAALTVSPAAADKIEHPIAVFDGLDKITGRILTFEVGIGESAQYGTLVVTPRVCYSRPATEAPQTDVFAGIDEVNTDKTSKRIFTGWMFADSPGLNGVEHPIYDIWLVNCKGAGQLIHETPEVAEAPSDSLDATAPDATPVATPAAKPTPVVKRRPKPAIVEAAPLDVDTAPRAITPVTRNLDAPPNNFYSPPFRRGGAVEVAPLPPADIPQ